MGLFVRVQFPRCRPLVCPLAPQAWLTMQRCTLARVPRCCDCCELGEPSQRFSQEKQRIQILLHCEASSRSSIFFTLSELENTSYYLFFYRLHKLGSPKGASLHHMGSYVDASGSFLHAIKWCRETGMCRLCLMSVTFPASFISDECFM